ncbi:MAG: ACT domain-containing protein [Polyangiaceae bacterium]
MSDTKQQADELRERMSQLDAEILAALDARAKTARQLGELRQARPSSPSLGDLSVSPSARELAEHAHDMPVDAVRAIFEEIHGACLGLERPVKIAFAGADGEGCHSAARHRFGQSATLIGAPSIGAALDEVTRKRAELAIAPFETASEGPVRGTLQALATGDLRVIELIERDHVRYAVICARPSGPSGKDVTAVVFKLQDAPGSLLDILRIFAERSINLTNVHSHPDPDEPWVYLFYLEIRGHFTDRPIVGAVEEMKRAARFFKLLGSYPSP